MTSRIHIKNMVCNRCLEAVQEEFRKAGIPVQSVQLGEVITVNPLTAEEKLMLKEKLDHRGFALLEDKNAQIIERIKTLVIEAVHYNQGRLKTNYSTYLEEEIHRDYSALSSLFSSVEGITIERFIIEQKIEKVKELLIYDQLTLSEIAYQLGYSSVQHLSNQFKKNTGMSPSHFKKMQRPLRTPLDQIGT